MDSWATPEWIMGLFGDWLDPCPLNDNPIVNGLNTDWENKTYVNPPYSNPKPWVEKAIAESNKGKTIAMLLKVDTSTQWFSLIQNCPHAHILWVNKRLKFRNPKGDNKESSPAGFPSMIVILHQLCNQEIKSTQEELS